MDAERNLQAAQLFPLTAQKALNPVVPVGQPVGQIHVGQGELRLGQRVGALRRHKQGILGTLTAFIQGLQTHSSVRPPDGRHGALVGFITPNTNEDTPDGFRSKVVTVVSLL